MPRPGGVTLIAVVDFVGALICVIFALLFFAGGSWIAGFLGAAQMPAGVSVGSIFAVAGAIFLLVGVLDVAIGVGLLGLKNWARILHIVFAAIYLLLGIKGIATAGIGTGSSMVISLALLAFAAWSIFYLLTANVGKAFKKA